MNGEKQKFLAYLAANQFKNTSQRRLIFEIFFATQDHVTVEELYQLAKKKDKRIGQTTVYRLLKILYEIDLADEVDFGDNIKRYEPKRLGQHHDHIVCRICKKPFEIISLEIEELQKRLAQQHGFILEDHKLTLYGSCIDCYRKQHALK